MKTKIRIFKMYAMQIKSAEIFAKWQNICVRCACSCCLCGGSNLYSPKNNFTQSIYYTYIIHFPPTQTHQIYSYLAISSRSVNIMSHWMEFEIKCNIYACAPKEKWLGWDFCKFSAFKVHWNVQIQTNT